jgi:toxin ParE1/3/4
MIPVRLGRAARSEYLAAAKRYEGIRTGLGFDFALEVRRALAAASEYPDRATIVQSDIRRIKTRRFPYYIFYRKRGGLLLVIAIFHSRRNPAVWRRRS